MPEDTARAPFPFFLGCGRSGTTLVWQMFDHHPDLAMAPEHHFPTSPPPRWLLPDGSLDLTRALKRIEHARWFHRFGLEEGALRAEVLDAPPTTYAGLIRCLYTAYARSQGKARYGNKTPPHVLHIAALARIFPEARFVHVVRDGRDVALSYLEKDFGPSDVRSAASFWRTRVERGHADGVTVGPQRYMEVHYEELVEDPERQLRRVCDFLEIGFDDAMLRYHEKPRQERRRDPHHHLAKPPTKGLRDWRSQMSRYDLVLFESIAGDTLEALGYPRSGVAPTGFDRMALLAGGARAGARARLDGIRVSSAVATLKRRPVTNVHRSLRDA